MGTHMLSLDQIKLKLSELSPEIPWAHLIEFSPNYFSVNSSEEKFYKKAVGLEIVGKVLLDIAEMQVRGHSLSGKKVLDLACGEGGHSIMFAKKGANVTGVEGRTLYVNRAKFSAEATGQNINIIQGDVRKLDPAIGTFDVVVFSGILHHLGMEDFDGMITELGRITDDMLLLYTHVSTEMSVKNHRLEGPRYTKKGVEGYLFREHKDNATEEEKEKQVRASLDNTFSFWAKESSLITAIKQSGFDVVLKVLNPHPFDVDNASYRSIIVAKKKQK